MKPYYEDTKSGITIYHGDCAELVFGFAQNSFSLLCTDPPYGIKADKNLRANKQHGNAAAPSKDYGAGDWDNAPVDSQILNLLRGTSTWQIIWGGNYFQLPAPQPCWLIFDKDNGSNGYADCELAWTNLEKAVRKIRYRWMGMLQEKAGDQKEVRYHPTQKPLDVMTWAIQQAPPGIETVFDPFMGSGTTLRAAKDLGLKAVGIDISEKYCEIAALRLQQEVLKL